MENYTYDENTSLLGGKQKLFGGRANLSGQRRGTLTKVKQTRLMKKKLGGLITGGRAKKVSGPRRGTLTKVKRTRLTMKKKLGGLITGGKLKNKGIVRKIDAISKAIENVALYTDLREEHKLQKISNNLNKLKNHFNEVIMKKKESGKQKAGNNSWLMFIKTHKREYNPQNETWHEFIKKLGEVYRNESY